MEVKDFERVGVARNRFVAVILGWATVEADGRSFLETTRAIFLDSMTATFYVEGGPRGGKTN